MGRLLSLILGLLTFGLVIGMPTTPLQHAQYYHGVVQHPLYDMSYNVDQLNYDQALRLSDYQRQLDDYNAYIASSMNMQQRAADVNPSRAGRDLLLKGTSVATSSKSLYEAYYIKPGQDQTIFTWFFSTTHILCTCGGAQFCKMKLKSFGTYYYTVYEGNFTDVSAKYGGVPVTIYNIGTVGDLFVSTW